LKKAEDDRKKYSHVCYVVARGWVWTTKFSFAHDIDQKRQESSTVQDMDLIEIG
jgi:hypothetical protein